MSTPFNGEHKSRSQRERLTLERQIEFLQQNAREYEAFINYVVTHHPTSPGVFRVDEAKMRQLTQPQTVRTELTTEDGKRGMNFTLIAPPAEPKSNIIIP